MENPEPFVERKKNDASNSAMISKTLEKFDIFGAPVTFYFRKHSTITSSTGGCVSLVVVIVCVIVSVFQFVKLINRDTLNLVSTTRYNASPKMLNMSKWRFGIGFDNYVMEMNNITNPLLIIDASWRQYTRSIQNGTAVQDKIKKTLKLSPCQRKDFPGLETAYDLNSNLQKFACPQFDGSMDLAGDFHDVDFRFIKIAINRCNPKFQTYCPNRTALDDKFADEGKLAINIIMMNNYFDVEDYEVPFKPTLNGELYVFTNPKIPQYKETNIFIKHATVTTTQSWVSLFPNDKVEESYVFSNDIKIDQSYQPESVDEFATFYFRSNFYSEEKTRKYDDVLAFLSTIGGFLNPILLTALFIVKSMNHIKFMIQVANENYSFMFPEKKGDDDSGKDSHQKPKLKVRNSKNGEDTELKPEVKRKERLPDKIRNHLKSITELEFKSKYFWSKWCCKRRYFNEREAVSKAYELSTETLDLSTILTRLEEIEKIKEILFSKKQLSLFNFFPKSTINCNFEKNTSSLYQRYGKEKKSLFNDNGLVDLQDQMQRTMEAFRTFLDLSDNIPDNEVKAEFMIRLLNNVRTTFENFFTSDLIVDMEEWLPDSVKDTLKQAGGVKNTQRRNTIRQISELFGNGQESPKKSMGAFGKRVSQGFILKTSTKKSDEKENGKTNQDISPSSIKNGEIELKLSSSINLHPVSKEIDPIFNDDVSSKNEL